MSPEQTHPDKRFDTARARAALLGATLTRTDDDRGVEVFVLTRWELTRALTRIEDVEAWLDRTGSRVR